MNVRFGSLADITARSRHVRFTPNSGHSSVQLECPKSAINGPGSRVDEYSIRQITNAAGITLIHMMHVPRRR